MVPVEKRQKNLRQWRNAVVNYPQVRKKSWLQKYGEVRHELDQLVESKRENCVERIAW